MDDTALETWRAARTFDELCELAARFSGGELAGFPGWCAHDLDAESLPLVAHLQGLQRAGLLTLASQPGLEAGALAADPTRVQRAFVTGFASPAAAAALETLGLASPLYVAVFPPGARGGFRTPVSARNGRAYAFSGYAACEEELACFADLVGPEALRALEASAYVCAIDLEWGRAPLLWSELARALGGARTRR